MTTDITTLIAAVRAADEAATPGPWSHCGTLPSNGTRHVCAESDTACHGLLALHASPDDATLIALYRHAAPRLAAECERLRADRDTATARAEAAEAECAVAVSTLRDTEASLDAAFAKIDRLTAKATALRAILDGLAPVLDGFAYTDTGPTADEVADVAAAWQTARAALAKLDEVTP